MPTYRYECLQCGHLYTDRRSMSTRNDGECPSCLEGADGGKNIRILMPKKINVVSDISHQEGRLGDSVAMPALGKDVRITSRRDLKDMQKRVRDKMWDETFGEHSTFIKDPDTGKMEKHTVFSEGTDIGEVHTQEKPATEYRGEDPEKVLADIQKEIRS